MICLNTLSIAYITKRRILVTVFRKKALTETQIGHTEGPKRIHSSFTTAKKNVT